ncbi:hypothetical protein H9643_07680 [Ochrobactrum sp. Sa2BUA5]|nr:hypothetical protein [Ochrobactrum gallinarum]
MASRLLPVSLSGIVALGGTILLTACASQVLKSYIGTPISSVMLDYGPPDNVYKLSANEQAYQWRRTKTQAVASEFNGEVRETRRGERYKGTETPGYIEHTECFYTFYTRRSGHDWYVTNFPQPSLECE